MVRTRSKIGQIGVGSLAGALLLVLLGCKPASLPDPPTPRKETNMRIQPSSSAFKEGQPIPSQFTCQGQDISPPLEWGDVPPQAKSLALIVDDPDAPAGTWVHWVLYDLPAITRNLPQAVPATETLEGRAKQGRNDFKKIGYGGPCPPPGKAHRYFFKLFALDTELGLKPGATKQDLLRAMTGHVLAEGQLMGTYQRH
jgi:Raf kinase inhibitor-like YbhB/YbcL family protein